MNKNFLAVLITLIILVGAGIFYKAVVSPSNSDMATTTNSTTTIVVPGVDNGNNNNPPVVSQATAPDVVTSQSVSPTDTTAIVNGTVNPKGAFTTYWYEYGVTTNLGTKTTSQNIGSGFIAIQAPGYIKGLTKNTTYYFRLVAENQFGRVSGGQYAFRTTEGTPAPVGSAPVAKTLAATNISRSTANINGEVTPNQASTQFWFEYGKTPQLGNISAFSSVGNGSAKVPASISLSNLEPLTTYYFRINAQNQFGTINGSILNFKTGGPAVRTATTPAVVSQSATNVATSTATLHGTVDPNGAETKYWFEYSTDSLLGSVLLRTTGQVTLNSGANNTSVRADVSSLAENTTYYFRLVAQNSEGTVRGDKITFKTK